MNATKERQAWCYLQVKLCDPCMSALSVPPLPKRRYINTFPFDSFPVCSLLSTESSLVTNTPSEKIKIAKIAANITAHVRSCYYYYRPSVIRLFMACSSAAYCCNVACRSLSENVSLSTRGVRMVLSAAHRLSTSTERSASLTSCIAAKFRRCSDDSC